MLLDLVGCCEMFWRAEDAEHCVVDRALETGERVEVEILVGNDESTPTLVIVQPLDSRSNGSRSGAVVIARDISDLRRAEADALAQRSFMASIADRSPDEIYALDKDGRITWMNERGEADDFFMLSGRYFVEFIAEDSRAVANEHIVSRHDGEILVVGEPDEGMRYEVRLPICDKISAFIKHSKHSAELSDQSAPQEAGISR